MSAVASFQAGVRPGSYQGQDRFVLETLGFREGGFFLDSGASDGFRGSNSWLLENAYGWSGICVEPNDQLFARLVSHRRARCIHACLFDRKGDVEFLEAGGVYGGIVQTYDPQHLAFTRRVIEERHGTATENLAPVRKSAIPLGELLETERAPSIIDYWSLDTEGSELRILESFPWDRYRVRVLTVEHNCAPVRVDLHDLLTRRGMVRVRDLGIDDGYVHRSELHNRAWRSRVWRR